ncbi:MAG TPA: GNAT family N-acetyltransferase [Longimicrobiaceae bacterium]|nr:GNAT family N-acetyltransferase [Longimicrobiaceae bacterium]
MAEEAVVDVVRNEAEGRFEATVDGVLAYLTYQLREGTLYLLHTEVPHELEGRGLGSRIVRAALDHARAAGLRVVAHCPFAKAYLYRRKEYQDLLGPEEEEE